MPIKNGWSVAAGATYMQTIMHYPELQGRSARFERMVGFLGVNKTF